MKLSFRFDWNDWRVCPSRSYLASHVRERRNFDLFKGVDLSRLEKPYFCVGFDKVSACRVIANSF